MPVFVRSSSMPVPVADLSDWHFRMGALDRLLPPWQDVRVLERPGAMVDGSVVRLGMRMFGAEWEWVARHQDARPGHGFTDVQERGPFARWMHRHLFLPQGTERSLLEDRVDYALPGGVAGRLMMGARATRELERMFAWRHQRTRNDLRVHARHGGERLRVAISGTGGLVGSALAAFLSAAGHDVRRIVRGAPVRARGDVAWNQRTGEFDAAALEGLDGVVHLAGAGIADRRWTEARKREIRASRVEGTHALATALAGLRQPPKVLVCASAIGFYGARAPDEPLTEASAPGTGFLPETCQAWEAAAEPARRAGIRVVHLRIGIVIAARGGVLGALRRVFGLGLGGPVGSGTQMMSWIALDDLLSVLRLALSAPLEGPVNAVAPRAVSNREFGRTLGRVLRRPAVAPVPAAAVSAAFGEMGRELLLGGAWVRPEVLTNAGHGWLFPSLEEALRFELGCIGAGEPGESPSA
jgi:uncharacterized protein (TIGR01777 family)